MTLSGIYSVEHAPAESVAFVPSSAIINAIFDNLSVVGNFTPICLVGLGELSDDCKQELGQDVHSVSLTFFSEHKPNKFVPSVFRVTDVNNRQYIIGTGSAPHPIVSYKKVAAGIATSKSGYNISIIWKSTTGLIPIP